jgi:hypothetical protein
MQSRKVFGVQATYQPRRRAGEPPPRTTTTDPRALKRSAFLITINTNMSVEDDDAADEMGILFTDVLNELNYVGRACEDKWGYFFRVNVGRGKKWLDKKETVPNPAHNPDFNKYYAEDDKQGIDHWCSLIEKIEIHAAGVEWAPGTKKNHKNQYLHAHFMVKVQHRTRLLIDREYVAAYFREKLHLPHKPYVHVDVVRDTTQKVIEYVTKNAWNANSQVIDEDTVEFFSQP